MMTGERGAARSPRPTGSTCGPGWRGSVAARSRISRWRGARGGGMSPRSWPLPGSVRMSASRRTLRQRVAASGTPRPTGPIPGICGSCWPTAGCLNAGSRRRTSWNAGRCWSCTTIFAPGIPHGCSASTRCCSTRAPGIWARVTCRAPEDLAQLRAIAAAQLSPAGQLQVATALDMLTVLEDHLDAVRRRLLEAARHLAGAKVLQQRLYGVGPVTALALTCWLGGAGRFSSSRKAVRFAGLDVTVYYSAGKRSPGHLSRQGPEVLRWCVYEAGKAHARTSAPDHAYYAQLKDRIDGKRAAISEARKIIRQACHILSGLGDDALTTT